MQSSVTLCNLGVGATFGESVLHDLPRDSTVVTKTTCELLRVEQQDFRLIWEVSALAMTQDISPQIDHTPRTLVKGGEYLRPLTTRMTEMICRNVGSSRNARIIVKNI